MKLLLSALLMASAMAAQAPKGRKLQTAAEVLEARWKMDEPEIAYDIATNVFTLNFETASASNTDPDMKEKFFDRNCAFDETGNYQEYEIPAGITAPLAEGGGPAELKMTTIEVNGAQVLRPQLKFEVNTQVTANDPNIYDFVDSNAIVADNTLSVDDKGKGVLRFCVRSMLGYTSNAVWQEVNFIETLVTIKYDLTAGFKVDAFNVEPKEREETTAIKDDYALEAYICDPDVLSDVDGRQIPDEITIYNVANGDGTSAFNQGALIQICVHPDTPTFEDGIVLNALDTFTWEREVPAVTQEAIVDNAQSNNGLTTYDPLDCVEADWCTFASILFADFYVSQGEVFGEGTATLGFKTGNRRLGMSDEDARKLEDAAADSSPFDVIIGVDITDEGPGGLRTAGGASFGLTTMATILALASAALFA